MYEGREREKEINQIIKNYKNLIVDCLEVINDPNNSDVKQFLINKGEIADDRVQTPVTPGTPQDSSAEAEKILDDAFPTYASPSDPKDRKLGEKGLGAYMDYYKKFNPMNNTPDTDPAGGATLTPEQLAPMNTPDMLNPEKLRALGVQNEEFFNQGKYQAESLEDKESSYNPGKNFMNNATFGLYPK